MNWLRLYTEARNDAKLRTLTDAEHRVWFNLLCYAAEQKPQRGSIQDCDRELMAIEVAGGDSDLLTATLTKLARLRILKITDDEIYFVKFLERQYDKPSDYPEATRGRKQTQREREADKTMDVLPNLEVAQNASKPDVTPCHAHTQNRAEDNRREKIPPAKIENAAGPRKPAAPADADARETDSPRISSVKKVFGNAGVQAFIDAYERQYQAKPILTDANCARLKQLEKQMTLPVLQTAVACYFADTTAWAAGHGHDVMTFLLSPDRWRQPPVTQFQPNSGAQKKRQSEMTFDDIVEQQRKFLGIAPAAAAPAFVLTPDVQTPAAPFAPLLLTEGGQG